jgi:hypothetical protein
MLDLKIDRLQLEINDAAGHEHRIGGIAQRAAALFAEQIDIRYGDGRSYPSQSVGSVGARPVNLDLNRTSDEHAASNIARAWLDALALRLKL